MRAQQERLEKMHQAIVALLVPAVDDADQIPSGEVELEQVLWPAAVAVVVAVAVATKGCTGLLWRCWCPLSTTLIAARALPPKP